MTIEKCKDFEKDGYGTWDDSSKPTTFANMYDFMNNQNNIVQNLAMLIWQPSTAYKTGARVHSPSLPAGCVAVCMVTGTTSATEPSWGNENTYISDGTITWKIEGEAQPTNLTDDDRMLLLESYVITNLQGVNDVTKYNQVRNFYFLARGADKLNGTTTDTDATTLTGIVSDWYKLTRKLVKDWDGWTRFAHPDVSSASEGTKMGSNANMVCVPSTETVAGRDDYASNPLFAITYCNWKMSTDSTPLITAIEGISDDFSKDSPSKLLGVLQMSAYVYVTDIDSNGDHYDVGYEANPNGHDGETPLPEAVKADGTFREWVLHGACACSLADDGNSYFMCYGQDPAWTGMSHNNMNTITAKMGNGISTSTSADDAFIKFMCYIKYGNLSLEPFMQGCVSNWSSSLAQVAETGVRRVIIPASEKGNWTLGSQVVIDNWDGKLGEWDSRNKSTKAITGKKSATITDIKDVTINGAAYCALYVDTDSAFDTSITDGSRTKIYSYLCKTGSTRNVLGNDGSQNLTDQKHAYKIQGIECSWGQYEVLSDVILNLTQDGDDYYYTPYICKNYAKRSTSVTSDYTACDVKLKSTEDWQYIKHEKYSKGYFFPDIVGGSASTYTRDAIYTNKTTGTREVLSFGGLGTWSTVGGLSCLFGYYALSYSYFDYGSRLSPNGTRG